MTSHELLVVGGGILLAILVVPFGGAQSPMAILVIAGLVVFDIARGRRKAERSRSVSNTPGERRP